MSLSVTLRVRSHVWFVRNPHGLLHFWLIAFQQEWSHGVHCGGVRAANQAKMLPQPAVKTKTATAGLRLNQTPVRLYAAQYVSLETSGRRSTMWPPYSLLRNLSAAAHVTVALTVLFTSIVDSPLQWRQNERNNVSNHQSLHWLLNCWFRHRWKKTSNSTSLVFVRRDFTGDRLLPHTKG